MPALIAGAFLVLCVSVYGLGTLSATVPRWIVVYGAAGCALGYGVWHVWKAKSWTLDAIDYATAAVFAYLALSLAWSGDYRLGAYQLINAGAVLAVFLWVKHAPASYVKHLPAAALLCILVAFVTHYLWPWDYGGHGNRNFQTEMLLIALAVGFVSQGWWLVLACLLFPVVIVYLLGWNVSKIEWFVGLCLLVWIVGRKVLHPTRPVSSKNISDGIR